MKNDKKITKYKMAAICFKQINNFVHFACNNWFFSDDSASI